MLKESPSPWLANHPAPINFQLVLSREGAPLVIWTFGAFTSENPSNLTHQPGPQRHSPALWFPIRDGSTLPFRHRTKRSEGSWGMVMGTIFLPLSLSRELSYSANATTWLNFDGGRYSLLAPRMEPCDPVEQ